MWNFWLENGMMTKEKVSLCRYKYVANVMDGNKQVQGGAVLHQHSLMEEGSEMVKGLYTAYTGMVEE